MLPAPLILDANAMGKEQNWRMFSSLCNLALTIGFKRNFVKSKRKFSVLWHKCRRCNYSPISDWTLITKYFVTFAVSVNATFVSYVAFANAKYERCIKSYAVWQIFHFKPKRVIFVKSLMLRWKILTKHN